MENNAAPQSCLSQKEWQALRVVMGLAVGRDKVSVESKKFLDGERNSLPPGLKRVISESVDILKGAA